MSEDLRSEDSEPGGWEPGWWWYAVKPVVIMGFVLILIIVGLHLAGYKPTRQPVHPGASNPLNW